MKSKRLWVPVGILFLIAVLIFVFCPTRVNAISKIPSWPPVCEERMADGTWYAYAKCDAEIWTQIKDGQIFTLQNQKGEKFKAIIKIHKPHPRPLSGIANPGRVWVDFENITLAPGQPKFGLAVIFKVW